VKSPYSSMLVHIRFFRMIIPNGRGAAAPDDEGSRANRDARAARVDLGDVRSDE
jgi:hypothetical protein